MTPYSRGYAAGLKAAAEVCKSYAKGRNAIAADPNERRRIRNSATTLALAAEYCANEILSLPIEGEADQRAKGEDSRTEQSCENGAAHPNPGEPVAQVMHAMANDGKCGPVAWFKSPGSLPDGTLLYAHPARPGHSQECVSDLSERLRQYADIADAGGKAHWANAMREAMYTLAVYRQNAAKEEHDAHR